VVQGQRQVAGLNRADGKVLWKVPVSGEVRVSVTKTSVVIEQRKLLQGVDLRSGQSRYRRTRDGYWPTTAVTADWVVVPDCVAKRKTCTVTGLQLPSFRRRWQVTYPFGGLPNVDALDSNLYAHYFDLTDALLVRPSEYVVFGREAPGDRLMTALAAASGKPGRTFSALDQEMILTSGRVGLAWSGSGCEAQLTGQDVLTGRRIWQQKADRWECPGEGRYPLVAGQSVAATILLRSPQVIDTATGKVRWSSKIAATPIGLTDQTLLARTREYSRAAALIALDTADGRQRWRIDLPHTLLGGSDLRAAINDDRLAYVSRPGEGDAHPIVHLNDARTGKPLWLAVGAKDILGLGSDWLITQAAQGAERIQLFDPR
jgi:outer membrane protein assembly factor BamB